MKEIQAPNDYLLDPRDLSIFLAGSIEMGTAEQWQQKVLKDLADYNVKVFNPRRDDWDSSWEQSIRNPNFREQVEWELDALRNASIIIFYFSPGTKSPITLLELGYHISDNKPIYICCPDGYWRKGNIEILCMREGQKLYHSLSFMIGVLKAELRKKGLKSE